MIGNYHLIIHFGEVVIPISTSILRELTIVQDFNKVLPEFRLALDDASGILTHVAPFDRNMSSVKIECAVDSETLDKNNFDFLVYSREPKSNQSTPANDYDVTGLLDVKNMFSPGISRGFSGSIKTTLETIAADFDIDSTDIDVALEYDKNIIQPYWSNVELLNYLSETLLGVGGEYGFKGFIKNVNSKKTLVFKSLSQMIDDPISYKFILNSEPYEDQLPIFDYSIFDNYGIFGAFGVRTQSWAYFDYDESAYVSNSFAVSDIKSLSDYFLIDKNDSFDNNPGVNTGRTNEYDVDFSGKIKSSYGNRLLNLTKMWITTQALPNASPGQTVQVFFPHGAMGEDLYSYQYSGYWLVERVVHNLGDAFVTKLLLTRHGLDTDKETSLLMSTSKK